MTETKKKEEARKAKEIVTKDMWAMWTLRALDHVPIEIHAKKSERKGTLPNIELYYTFAPEAWKDHDSYTRGEEIMVSVTKLKIAQREFKDHIQRFALNL